MAVNQDEYGKFGVLRESDFFSKQREFEAYMHEVKKIPSYSSASKREIMEYFADFCEDFNTVTMPHPKYYDWDKWEAEEYRRRQEEAQGARGGQSSMQQQEEAALRERRAAEERKEREFLALTRQMINKDKKAEMRRQDLLRTEAQIAFRTGDLEKARRIEARLKPDKV